MALSAHSEFGTKLDTSFILSMAKIKDQVKTLLDIDRVVTADTIIAISRAA